MNYFKRLWIYFKEMFPLQEVIISTLVVFFSFFFLLGKIHGTSQLFYPETWYALVSILLYSIIFRLNDEIKDEEFDKKFNPNRSLVTGRVKFSDIKILTVFLFIVITVINFDKGFVTSVFLVWIIFLMLSARWFYIDEDKVRNNFALASITHQPMLPLTYFYIYAVFLSVTGSQANYYYAVPLFILFSITYTGWEIARKTRAPSDETEYQSYSKIWGVKKATIIPMIYIIITTASLVVIGCLLNFSIYYMIANLALGIVVITIFLRFLLNPITKRNHLKKANELYDLLFRLIIIIEIVVRSFL